MRKQLTLVLMLTIALVGTTLAYAGGRGGGRGQGQGHGQGGGMNLHDSLTEEQHTALHDKVTEMREVGATREEIQKARREMLEGYSVELPEDLGKRGGFGKGGSGTDHEDCSGNCENCASEESEAASEETAPDVTP